jgi:NAD(P)-dependent dehydrogenase (short-subunit alcohol dehydrogenase family)
VSKRVALVTGGTRGIGLGRAQALAAEGWDLALCGVREQEAVQPCWTLPPPAQKLYVARTSRRMTPPSAYLPCEAPDSWTCW